MTAVCIVQQPACANVVLIDNGGKPGTTHGGVARRLFQGSRESADAFAAGYVAALPNVHLWSACVCAPGDCLLLDWQPENVVRAG